MFLLHLLRDKLSAHRSGDDPASAVAFIAAGFRSGERCLYTANDSPFGELVRQLARLGVNVAQETEKGSLEMLTKRDV